MKDIMDENDLKDKRNKYYAALRKHSINGLMFKAPQGNHMNFVYQGCQGHVNWYFRSCDIGKYDGNVCVVFTKSINRMPKGFREHPFHSDLMIASETIEDLNQAVNWTLQMIQSVK